VSEDGEIIDNVTPLSAKIDFVSAAGPLFQEIKYGEGTITEDVNVLNQALGRVYVLRSSYAQLKRIVAIAIGPMYSSIIVFHRNLSEKKMTEKLRIIRIAKNTISDIWSCITFQMIKAPHWFLTDDANHLNAAIKRFGILPSMVRTHLIKESIDGRHRVYNVNLPKLYKPALSPQGLSVMGCSRERNSFAIKIFHDQTNFANESANAMSVRKEFNKMHEYAFYVLTCGDLSARSIKEVPKVVSVNQQAINERVLKILKESQNVKFKFPNFHNIFNYSGNSSIWNFFNQDLTEASGGYLIMLCGETVSSRNDFKVVLTGVASSLAAAHRARICHCDVRMSNVLVFGTHCQLVDFDLSRTEDGECVLVAGAQFDNRGPRLSKFNIGDTVHWKVSDDIEMLYEMTDKVV
jgi:hypothetical protein